MKQLFLKSPYFLKFLIINLVGFFVHKKRYNKNFFQNLKHYMDVDKTEVFSFDYEMFNKQMSQNTYYDKEIRDITKYPISNKAFIKKHYSEIINNNEIYDYLHTSGTTGVGLKFPISKEFISHQWAIFWKFRKIHGLNIDTRVANIIGKPLFKLEQSKPPYWVLSYTEKQLFLSGYHLNKDTVEAYINKIKSSDIHWLHAYPSILNNFATLIQENGFIEKAKQLNLFIITTSSEKLLDFQRENIEKVFNCTVRQLYGLVEGVANIFECEFGTLHIDETYSYVELISTDSDEYKIVGTSYFNKAFPLVRYDTGDRVKLYENGFQCSCGRKSRVVKEILGRNEDYIVLSNGTKIGRLSPLFKSMVNIKEAQVYQEKPGEATFNIVKDCKYVYADEVELINQIHEKLGQDFIYDIIYLEKISRTKNGKLKFVVNKLNTVESNV